MDVDRLAQMRPDHRRAFDVPAGPPPPPRRVPANDALGARLPQHEVGGIALVRRDLDPCAGDHRVAVAAAERPIIGVARHRKQHVALGFISVAGRDQRRDHRHHRRDFGGGVRRDGRRRNAQRTHVLEVKSLEPLGDLRRLDPFRLGRGDDLVVDVGDVAGISQAVGPEAMADQPRERVEHHRRPGIADMRPAVNRRPAHIHGDVLRVGGDEVALLARHRVIEPDHPSAPRPRRASTKSTIPRPLALSSG